MDDLEFRKHAIINPESQEPDFLEKKNQSVANCRFVSEQLEFNHQLTNALHIQTPENLADRIILSQQLSQHKQQLQRKRQWLISGLVASIAALIFFVQVFFLQSSDHQHLLQQQIISHIYHDTHALDVTMEIPKNHIDTMLASYGGKLNGPIGHVSFLGHCIIGDQTGIHLVLNTISGKVTVFILPTQAIDKLHPLQDKMLRGVLYPTDKGSIAILSEHADSIDQTRQTIDQNLNWII